MAAPIRSLCSAITKIARADLQSRLESHGCGIGAIEHGVLRHLSHGVTSMAEISRLMGVAASTTYKVALPGHLSPGEYAFLVPEPINSSTGGSIGKAYTFRVVE
jgi:hypothetical protein